MKDKKLEEGSAAELESEEDPQGGIDRRTLIKSSLTAAVAAGAVFAPAVRAVADVPQLSPIGDFEVNAQAVMACAIGVTKNASGISPGTTSAVVDPIHDAIHLHQGGDQAGAQAALGVAEVAVNANLAEINGANLNLDVGGQRLGDVLLVILAWIIANIAFILLIIIAKLNCIRAAYAAYAICLGLAATFFVACILADVGAIPVIPFFPNVFPMIVAICAGLTGLLAAACLAQLQADLAACC